MGLRGAGDYQYFPLCNSTLKKHFMDIVVLKVLASRGWWQLSAYCRRKRCLNLMIMTPNNFRGTQFSFVKHNKKEIYYFENIPSLQNNLTGEKCLSCFIKGNNNTGNKLYSSNERTRCTGIRSKLSSESFLLMKVGCLSASYRYCGTALENIVEIDIRKSK